MTALRGLLQLPDHVSKGDFVQSLAESLDKPERTVATYAPTPDLAENFRQCLRIVAGALSSGRSQPVFLHGSFGSGKSHFMAMLNLILQGHPAPWRKAELHPVRERFEPLAGKNLLQLHFHMLGARSLESQVFARYVQHVDRHHPEAPLPALFQDHELFENARQLRQTMGDGAFFKALNRGKEAVAGFGNLGEASTWTSSSFEAAVTSSAPPTRARLLSDLTRTLLPAFARQSERFVGIDEGLAELTRHAAGLGYEGVVLYLDELILWLASQSADLAFVQREINKLVKLKEAQDEGRAIPIVAFIARQRDLSDLVGEGATGSERALIEETFGHHASRFDTVDLSDSNLRAIIPHRVVVARSAADRERIDDGFEKMWKGASQAQEILQAGTATREECRQVYPFSPALIDALVALSDRLQRDRTAIRILVEMLVEHQHDLELGQVVPVGDVFDLVASADDAVDGPSKEAFQRARELYHQELLPRIQALHDTATPQACQRLRPGHPIQLGCSNCAQSRCRNDNRLVKTLLLAALVPKARPFDDLSVRRLVHLNHGAVMAPLESMKINQAATALRDLAREVHAINVGEGADPPVSISLQSIDLKPILARAADQDTRQRRRYMLRRLLWEELELSVQDNAVTHTVEFFHTKRAGRVRFGNVRTMRTDELRCPGSDTWQVVIDYPFDEAGYTPQDDERRVEEARGELGGRPESTLVWLPTFFSQRLVDDLGDLARLEHILQSTNLRAFLSTVPPDQHPRARVDLENLQGRKRAEVKEGLRKAYGLVRPAPDDPHIDPNRDVQQHVLSLDDRLEPRTPRAASLKQGLEDLAQQLLHARYPKHPRFLASPNPSRLDRVRRFLETLLDEPPGKVLTVSKAEGDDLMKIADPLYLTNTRGLQVERVDRRYEQIERARNQRGEENPTLPQVIHWLDPEDQMGLDERLANLVAWLWAYANRREARDGPGPACWPSNARLSDSVFFRRPDLPSEAVWHGALKRAGRLGITQGGKALNARNVNELAKKLQELARGPRGKACPQLEELLKGRLKDFGPPDPGELPRLVTAQASRRLVAAMEETSERALLEAFASQDLGSSSMEAVERSLSRAPEVVRELGSQSPWTVLSLLVGLLEDERFQGRAQDILQRLSQLLSDDELNAPLVSGLRALVAEANELIQKPRAIEKPQAPEEPRARGWKVIWETQRTVPAAQAEGTLERMAQALAQALEGASGSPEGAQRQVRIELVVEEKEGEA